MHTRSLYFLLFLFLNGIISCSPSTQKLDWQKVITKYSNNNKDSLELLAALYLKENINGQVAEKIAYYSEITGKEEAIYLDTISGNHHLQLLLAKHHLIPKGIILPDSILLTNELIESTIENAVESWKFVPDENRINWQCFLEYILPYKIIGEQPENWRKKVKQKYDPMIGKIAKDSLYQILAIDSINNDVKKWFTFNIHSYPRSWQELSATKEGDCIAISCLMCFTGRAYGIPVAIDYCPVWANINGEKHYWNSILVQDKKCIPFMGGESDPMHYNPFLLFKNTTIQGDKSTFKKCGKVFRQTFSINKNNIHTWIKENSDIPATLFGDRYIDVTKEYFSVADISLSIDSSNNQNAAYLCVYNKGEWVPTWWTKFNNRSKIVFSDMAKQQLYLPALFYNSTTIPVGNPLISADTGIRFLNPDFDRKIIIKIKNLKSVEQEQIDLYNHLNEIEWAQFEKRQHELAADKSRAVVQKGIKYILYYWDKKWVNAGTTTCRQDYIEFKKIPSNCLYKISQIESSDRERIFTYEKEQQIWW